MQVPALASQGPLQAQLLTPRRPLRAKSLPASQQPACGPPPPSRWTVDAHASGTLPRGMSPCLTPAPPTLREVSVSPCLTPAPPMLREVSVSPCLNRPP